MSIKEKWKVEKRNENYKGYSGYKIVTKIETKSGKGGYMVIANIADSSDAKDNAQLIATSPELLDNLEKNQEILYQMVKKQSLNKEDKNKIDKLINSNEKIINKAKR
ncbi:MAG: hypothetical protein ACOCP8_00540 [archaeon]